MIFSAKKQKIDELINGNMNCKENTFKIPIDTSCLFQPRNNEKLSIINYSSIIAHLCDYTSTEPFVLISEICGSIFYNQCKWKYDLENPAPL